MIYQDAATRYRNWRLVDIGGGRYNAQQGKRHVAVGTIRNGDKARLLRRFHKIVDRMEGNQA